VEVLSSGSDRPPRRPVLALLAWRPPTGVVAAVTVLLLVVTSVAGAALGPLRERAERLPISVRVLASTIAVRGSSTEGAVHAVVSNPGRRPVDLLGVELDLPGVALLPLRGEPARSLPPGAAADARVRFAVPDCGVVAVPGRVRIAVAHPGAPPRLVELPVADDPPPGGIAADVFTAGCRPASAPYVVALAVSVAGGTAVADGGAARGELQVVVRNHGGAVQLVSVTAEVPGVLFVSQTDPARNRWTDPGEQLSVPLPFVVPFCGEPGRTGRLFVTVRDQAGELRTLAFPADGSAVDLTLVFGACRRPG
jgi:hypothetical protein